MKIMVSACLLGENCKYSGGNNYNQKIADYLKGYEVIPICPEVMGGLPIPRTPAEIVNGVVTDANGKIVNSEFLKGANLCLKKAKEENIDLAILKSKSPSCGAKEIYDGTFTGTLKQGRGILAELLIGENIKVIDSDDFI